MADITQRMSAAEFRQAHTSSGKHPQGKPKFGRNKYGNQRTPDGFDSKKEARIFQNLSLMERSQDPNQRVAHIERQHRYLLIEKQAGERASYYKADFVVTLANGETRVIDVKSEITRKNPVYVLKRKLMLERHGVKIVEM